MDWTVLSAVTAAMLTAATPLQVIAAASPDGQVRSQGLFLKWKYTDLHLVSLLTTAKKQTHANFTGEKRNDGSFYQKYTTARLIYNYFWSWLIAGNSLAPLCKTYLSEFS